MKDILVYMKGSDSMKLLVVGSGGREHAIVWKLNQSPKVSEIYCAPGNAGIADVAQCVDIKATDIEELVKFAKDYSVDLTVVGMDDPLMMGIVDAFEKEGLRIFGPNRAAALIEGSKVFSKDLMKKYDIPSAAYEVFEDSVKALDYLKLCQYPIVLKADGLALGKGVLICQSFEEAKKGVQTIMIDKKFGEAGNRMVVEEFMIGPEVSMLAFCDGEHIIPMVSAQDHKRALDGNKGLNTGGMGTFSPSKYYTKEIHKQCKETIYQPTLNAMKAEGRPFSGILFFGLMLTENGPKVLEYNARFGDPEAQVVLPRLKNDLLEIIEAALEQKLHTIQLEWKEESAICVILASGGYPVAYTKGYEITGLNNQTDKEDVTIFHAGTTLKNGKTVTNGGRVLGITTLGQSIEDARQKAYQTVDTINFDKKQYRTDIGK